MNRIRTRLILIFAAATLLPLAATLLITKALIERSLTLSRTRELDRISQTLQVTGRGLYQATGDSLRAEARAGTAKPTVYSAASRPRWPESIAEFAASAESERLSITGEEGGFLNLMTRRRGDVLVYQRQINGPGMNRIAREYSEARSFVERSASQDLRRGFVGTLVVLSAAVWIVSLAFLVILAQRISRPLEELTAGLRQLARGDLKVRVQPRKMDEVGEAMVAFNQSAVQLEQSQERLVQVTRVATWQVLAKKMAHEVKNSLTPIRLTMEELVARKNDPNDGFLEQAAQIVIDEVTTLERRTKAFSEFASEPPVNLEEVDVSFLLKERMDFLKKGNPGVTYIYRHDVVSPVAITDEDLLRGILTNLIENAAQAAGRGGTVLGQISSANDKLLLEVHDSGPGLNSEAKESLFEPTISFKKAGMGLGLSIAKRSALLVGGDLVVIDGKLGGAAFCVQIPLLDQGEKHR